MDSKRTIVVVLRSGGDFKFRDVELIARHINGKWRSNTKPRIICLWDRATEPYDLGNIEILPLKNDLPGTWSRMALYTPEMEQYRPFLYVDLDTAIIQSLENIINKIPDPSLFIPIEDFWQPGQLATGIAWIPANSNEIDTIWKTWQRQPQGGTRMDSFLRKCITPKLFFQNFVRTIYDFKPKHGGLLNPVPEDADIVCFHGKPRIFQLAEASMSLDWVKNYVEASFEGVGGKKRCTVIIPYNIDRGWLKEAINSVPKDCQLLISQGDGNWPENFNKVLALAEGEYIHWLHEDDMLTENCIEDSIKAIEDQGVDFIHGNALELSMQSGARITYKPRIAKPTIEDLMRKNTIHSTTLMYKRIIFEALGGLNETLDVMEEYEFNLRCLKAGFKIGYCNSLLAVYRRHPQQKVRMVDKEKKINEKRSVNQQFI
jgi:hypothetical protein